MEKKNTKKKDVKEIKKDNKVTSKKEIKKEEVEKEEKEIKEEKKNKEETPKKEKKETKKETKKKKISKETKEKIFKGVGIFVLVLAVLGLASWVSSSYGANYEFEKITLDKYFEYLNDSEKRIILLARPDCSWCQLEDPIIKSVARKNKLKIYYLDATPFYSGIEDDPFTEDGKKLINSAPDWFTDGIGTPNTLIVQNGKIIDGAGGYAERSQLETLFKDNGFM